MPIPSVNKTVSENPGTFQICRTAYRNSPMGMEASLVGAGNVKDLIATSDVAANHPVEDVCLVGGVSRPEQVIHRVYYVLRTTIESPAGFTKIVERK
jgi:hypothetical protein